MIDVLRLSRRGATAALTPALLAAAALAAATGSFAMPRYDGLWSVSIVTEKGSCDRGYRYPVRIANGVLINAGDSAITVSGRVAPSGAVTVVVSNGSSTASGSGRLSGDSGAGTWRGGTCSGSWTAERRNAVLTN